MGAKKITTDGGKSQIRVVPYTDAMKEQWDTFVDDSINGTVFHKQSFLSYHPSARFQDRSLLLFEGDKLVSVVPAAETQMIGVGRLLRSHPGSSYGGPVFTQKVKEQTIIEVLATLESYAINEGYHAIEMRLPPHPFHRLPFEGLEFALHFHEYSIVRSELTSTVDLQQDEDLMQTLASKTRNQLKQAMKTKLKAEVSKDFEQFWEILANNLAGKHEATPTHSLEEIKLLQELVPDTVHLIAACEGSHMAAGVLVVKCNSTTAHTFYMASRPQDQPNRPLNLALFETMRWAKKNSFRHLNLGVSTPEKNVVNWGLLHFKRGHGGRGYCRNSFRKILKQSTPAKVED